MIEVFTWIGALMGGFYIAFALYLIIKYFNHRDTSEKTDSQ
jgi:hypothetical protein